MACANGAARYALARSCARSPKTVFEDSEASLAPRALRDERTPVGKSHLLPFQKRSYSSAVCRIGRTLVSCLGRAAKRSFRHSYGSTSTCRRLADCSPRIPIPRKRIVCLSSEVRRQGHDFLPRRFARCPLGI